MPRSTHEQRESVRQLALSVGVREAARQLGLNEQRVTQWSKRFQWFSRPFPPKRQTGDCHQIVTKAADALANTLANEKQRTISALSRASVKHAEHFAKSRPSWDLKRSSSAKNWASVADTVHNISRSNDNNGATLDVNVLAGRARMVIAIDTEQVTDHSHAENVNSSNSITSDNTRNAKSICVDSETVTKDSDKSA